MRKSQGVLLALVCACTVSFAQKQATGSVTGHVTCADTNTPARLATVVLRPVPSVKNADPKAETKPVEARRVQTLLDGSFMISSLLPGTYLVMGSMPGYLPPLAMLGVSNEELFETTEDVRKRILERVPTITVDARGTASINLSLERAAAVSGTVLYEDGAPAPGIQIELREKKDGKWITVQTGAGDGMGSGNSVTDDRGNFRITGLPPLKQAMIAAYLSAGSSDLTFGRGSMSVHGGPSFTLTFYSGGVLRDKDAKPFELTAGEDRTGEDITLPLSKLHKLEGVLVAKKDGHVLNSGSVSLLFADDKTVLGAAFISKDDEGFRFAFVPEGDYLLRVNSAADASFEEVPNAFGSMPPTHPETKILQEYGSAEIPIHIDADRTDVTINVPDKAPAGKAMAQQ